MNETLPAAEPRRRKTYKIAGPQTWALAREFYLSGMPAPEVARRLDVSEHNLRRKAWKEGWSRRQHAERVLDVKLPAIGGDRSSSPRLVEGAEARRAPDPTPDPAAWLDHDQAAALAPHAEADPLKAAKTLLRRAAGAALDGRAGPAQEEMKLASDLLRGVRLLTEAQTGGRFGFAALAEEDDEEPQGWRDSAESQALDETILRGLDRIRAARGRTPPQRLPHQISLEDHPDHRPLAEALGLAAEGRDLVECPDFDAAVDRAYAQGRGEAVERALHEFLPLELCPWLDEAAKDALRAQDDAAARLRAAVAPPAAAVFETEEATEPEAEGAPRIRRVDEADEPWRSLPRRRPGRISEP